TLATIDIEFEPKETPPHRYPLITYLLRHHLPRPEFHTIARMALRTQLTLSPGMSARIVEAAALSPSSFRKRYRSSYEIPSPSSSPTLRIWKRYQEDGGPGSEGGGLSLEEEGPGSEEEVAPQDQQQAVLVVDTTTDEPLGLGYRVLRRYELALGEGSVPSTFEIE
nr:hypothetical protein [Tanacetum cinerariifolium]